VDNGLRADLDFIKMQLSRLPTRNDVWRAAMLGVLGGAVAAVTLIEAFSRSCLGGSFSPGCSAARPALPRQAIIGRVR